MRFTKTPIATYSLRPKFSRNHFHSQSLSLAITFTINHPKMPPKRRVSSRKRHRSPGVNPASRPTQAARLDNDVPVLSPVPEADEPQGGPAGAGEEDCVYAGDDSHNTVSQRSSSSVYDTEY